MKNVEELKHFADRLEAARNKRQRLETVLREFPGLTVEVDHVGRNRCWIINSRWVLRRDVFGKLRTPYTWQELNRLGDVVDSGEFE